MQTTLNKIRDKNPCELGWKILLSHLGKTKADDDPLSIATILDSNGIDDAIWCLCAVENRDREIRLFAVWCARQVQHLMTDPRSIAALDVAESFANGTATKKDLSAAQASAVAASWSAAQAAAQASAVAAVCWRYLDAAWYAALAARDASVDSAWDAARSAQAMRLREICSEINERK